MVDLNSEEMYAKQLSPIDISNALNLQNLILPAGTAKLGGTEYPVRVNSSPVVLDDIERSAHQNGQWRNGLPERRSAGPRRFSSAEQYRPHHGSRGVLISITRNGRRPRWPSSTP